jgi:hypothetical protein
MAEVFTHPFTTYDGTLISSQKELDDWCKENNKFTPTDSMEDLQRQEKKIQDRKDKEEYEEARKLARSIINSSHRRDHLRKRDMSNRSNYSMKEIRDPQQQKRKIRNLTPRDGERTFGEE